MTASNLPDHAESTCHPSRPHAIKTVPGKLKGSVLLISLVFLLLTSMIAMSIMDSSIMQIRLAANQQFKEESMMIIEGVVDYTRHFIKQKSKDIRFGQLDIGSKLCDANYPNTLCEENVLELPTSLTDMLEDEPFNYYMMSLSKSTSSTTTAEGYDIIAYSLEMVATLEGTGRGLPKTEVIVGFEAQGMKPPKGEKVCFEDVGCFTGG